MKYIGVIGLGNTGIGICKVLRESYGECINLKGLYRKILKNKDTCNQLSITTYPFTSLKIFLRDLDWVIITVNKDWFNITQSVINNIKPHTSLILISSTSVYGDRNGALVNEDTSLDISTVRDYLKELINAEQLVRRRNKSYVLRAGLLYKDIKELNGLLTQINSAYTSNYINITQRDYLYDYINSYIGNKSNRVINNVISQSVKVEDLSREIGINNLNGIYCLYTNVYIN